MQGITATILHLIDHVGPIGLFVGMALGNVGAPIGSEIVLPAAGALSATGHLPSLPITIAIAVVAELVGQSIGYAVGRFGGRPLATRYGRFVHLGPAEMDRIDGFFRRYGSFAIFICRFTPVLRGIVGIPAGIWEMPLAPFYLWTLLGSIGFCGGLILLGSELGTHLDTILPVVHRYLYALLALIVAAIVVAVILSLRRRTSSLSS